jgi:TonB family protein
MTASLWLRDLAAYGLQVTLLVGAGALLARLFRFRAAAATLVYWQVLLAACLVLPVCQRWQASRAEVAPGTPPVAAAAFTRSAPAPSAPVRAPRPVRWPIEQIVLLAIAGGVILRGLWLATGFWGLARLKRDASVLPAQLECLLKEAQGRLGVRADFRRSVKAPAPITFGWRRPTILLPANLAEMEPHTQQAIVYHELLHVRRRDWAWCVAEEFARAVLWFHPAVWWLIERIHLTREQVVDQEVIELTSSRERYAEALLAIARARIQARFVPAPLFLRKGSLKQRVAEILKETAMTKRRLILCLAVSAAALFLVARAATSIFPLRVHAQEFGSAPIQVVQGGDNLVFRAALVYPGQALERRIEGDVALELSVDEQGQVSDARVLSGPEELRRACLRSVLEWRFKPSHSAGTTQVQVHFQLPTEKSASEIVLPPSPQEGAHDTVLSYILYNPAQVAVLKARVEELKAKLESPDITEQDKADTEAVLAKLKVEIAAVSLSRPAPDSQNVKAEVAELQARIASPDTAPEDRAKLKKALAERDRELANQDGDLSRVIADDGGAGWPVTVIGKDDERHVNGTLMAIRSERVEQATLQALTERLGVHLGDMITEQTAQQVRETVTGFDEHLRAVFHPVEGGIEMVILRPSGD